MGYPQVKIAGYVRKQGTRQLTPCTTAQGKLAIHRMTCISKSTDVCYELGGMVTAYTVRSCNFHAESPSARSVCEHLFCTIDSPANAHECTVLTVQVNSSRTRTQDHNCVVTGKTSRNNTFGAGSAPVAPAATEKDPKPPRMLSTQNNTTRIIRIQCFSQTGRDSHTGTDKRAERFTQSRVRHHIVSKLSISSISEFQLFKMLTVDLALHLTYESGALFEVHVHVTQRETPDLSIAQAVSHTSPMYLVEAQTRVRVATDCTKS